MAVKRVMVVAASAFVASNIWTGAPLLALWIGSQAVGQTVLSMKAVVIVIAVLAITVFALAVLLAWLNDTYRGLIARSPERRQPQWLSHLGEEPAHTRAARALTPVEWITVISVPLAVSAFFIWFFFIAGSPLPG
jgi:formate hydrogenlyase subunit 3/multisubunit Na+/H+ antiporter MnhD subunit